MSARPPERFAHPGIGKSLKQRLNQTYKSFKYTLHFICINISVSSIQQLSFSVNPPTLF